MSNDLTNQQLLEALADMFEKQTETMATKADVTRLENKIEKVDQKIDRVDRKLNSHKQAGVHHHLAIRQDIGELNRKFDNLCEGLARAVQG